MTHGVSPEVEIVFFFRNWLGNSTSTYLLQRCTLSSEAKGADLVHLKQNSAASIPEESKLTSTKL